MKLMKLFSKRNSLDAEPCKVQERTVDKALRTRLWNIISRYYWERADSDMFVCAGFATTSVNPIYDLAKQIQEYYFNLPLDDMGNNWEAYYAKLRERFFGCVWYKIYDFLEFLISTNFIDIQMGIYYNKNFTSFSKEINEALEFEGSAYRLVGKIFTKISDPVEVEAVNKAISQNPYENARIHIRNAEKLLSDRVQPDYRNSIKESISAVEAVCKDITGDEKGTLGGAIKKLEDHGIYMHEAFKSSINKMYGYTSDASGIRHCLMDGAAPDFADAKYMLVCCSAFCNFMIDKGRNLHR